MILRATLALLGTLLVVPASVAATPSYLCGPAKVRHAERAGTSIVLTDRLGTSREATLGRIEGACWAESPSADRMASFAARAPKKSRRVGTSTSVLTRFGTEQIVVKSFVGVAAGSGAGVPRTCYAVRGKRPGGRTLRVVFTDGSGERAIDIGRPTRVCLPTGDDDAPELLCHAVRPAKTTSRAKSTTMTVDTAFGVAELRVGVPRELCVPALTDDPPPPPPDTTLRIMPSAVTVLLGDQTQFEVTAHFSDGHEESFTNRVRLMSSDETVVASTSVGGAFVETVGVGSATITAIDLLTGLASSGAGNAVITVVWPVERLVITPHESKTFAGRTREYSVRAFLTGHGDRNVTQQVVYASSDPTIVSAPNTAPRRSRVFTHKKGTVAISATDPISGVSTTDTGDDATLVVQAKLIGVGVESGLHYSSLFPGQVRRWKATGYYDDGTTKNFTQDCSWWSNDPAVAVAPNQPGDVSRIEAVAPGYTTIGCTYGSFTSYATPFWVLGELVAIDVRDNSAPADWMPEGGSVRLTAVGQYEGGGFYNLSQDVEWTSLDPSIAVAPNAPGDRSRIDAVSPGDAVIRATDPTTGLFDDATVVSVGKLVSLQVVPLWGLRVIPVGVTRRAEVRGIFEHRFLNLTNREPGSFTLQSSDPAILEVLDDRRVLGVGTGVVELTATNGVLTSPPVQVTVQGSMQSPSVTLSMAPAATTRGIGEFESFTVTAFFPPGNYDNFTPYVQFTSSDHAVAVPSGIPWWPSRFDTVGPGTATITATHVPSGKTATSTLTVLPGAIERVTIEPASAVRNPMNGFSFTAIGHYPGGATVNVTQVCTWISLTPEVATAPNAAGDRSRIVAGTTAGDATIVAVHPSGVSSHDTGDDATLISKPLASIALTPEAHIGSVGTVERYTFVGTFDDQSTINLTQDALYWTDDVTVAVADVYEGDRSAVRMVAPGETTVHAMFADWTRDGAQGSGSVAGAFLRVVP